MHQVDSQLSEEKSKSLWYEYIQYFENRSEVLEKSNFSALLAAAMR